MLQLDHEYHPIDHRNLCDLRKVSFAARAVYLELFCGSDRTKHGVVPVRVASLEDDSGIPRDTIVSAVAELHAAGLIVHDQANKLAYHVGHALRHTYNAKLRVGWLRVCDGLPAGTARDALAQELAGLAYRTDTVSIPSAYRQHTVSIPSGIDWENGNGNGNENRNSVPNGTQPVAAAPVTGWTFQPHKPKAQDHTLDSQKSEVEQRLSYNDGSNPETEANTEQGGSPDFLSGNEDDEVPDWAAAAMAKAAAPAALPSFPGVRNPEVAARLAAADAERQASLTLTAPKAKPTKTLTPKQLDAIFAREQMAKWVAEWNGDSGMAKVNAPAVMADVAKLATVLMGHAARLSSVDGALVGPHELLGWAAKHGGYHGGSGAKKWTLKGWLSSDHVGEVFAAYRDFCAKAERRKMWTYQTTRTLTDWREEHAEATELAARNKELTDAA